MQKPRKSQEAATLMLKRYLFSIYVWIKCYWILSLVYQEATIFHLFVAFTLYIYAIYLYKVCLGLNFQLNYISIKKTGIKTKTFRIFKLFKHKDQNRCYRR